MGTVRSRILFQRQLNLHRWLGAVAAATLLLFGSSGLLHIAMSRLQPEAAAFIAPTATVPAAGLSLATVLNRHGIDVIASARTVSISGRSYYRVRTTSGTRHYFSARNGNRLPDGERRHAEALARHFSGDNSAPLLTILLVNRFDRDYLPVNRLLPVWRIELARPDHLTLYVDTEGDRLATLTDDRKRMLQGLFRQLHTFAWLEGHRWPRLALMLTMLAATGIAVAVGASLWGRRRPLGMPPLRRWHRRAGLAVVIPVLAFVISGSWHLLHTTGAAPPPVPTPAMPSVALTHLAAGVAFTLLDTPAGPCYLERSSRERSAAVHHQHTPVRSPQPASESPCRDATTGAVLPDAERAQAIRLAQHYAGSTAPAVEVTAIERFGNDYGFINKRLPVWRVVLAGDPSHWYVETTSGALALRSEADDTLAASVFSNLHKWQFFGDTNRGLRDTLQVVVIASAMGVGAAGLVLFARRASSIKPRRVKKKKAR